MAATIWKGHLSFGLVAIPIKLYRAARPEKVSFRHLYRVSAPPPFASRGRDRNDLEDDDEPELPVAPAPKKGAKLVPMPPIAAKRGQAPPPTPAPVERVEPVRHRPTTQDESEMLDRSEIVKGYEYERGQYVVLSQDELRALEPPTAREMQILEFVQLSEIDPLLYESSYYAAPDRGGEKSYSLLFEALRKTQVAGVAEIAMQKREHVVIIRPGSSGLIVHRMFYANETHAEDEYRTDTAKINQKELDLAQLLIQNMAAPFDVTKYRDTYRERLEALIEEKLKGKIVAHAEPPRNERVHDIMAALQQSLAATAARKPADTEKKKPRSRHGSGHSSAG